MLAWSGRVAGAKESRHRCVRSSFPQSLLPLPAGHHLQLGHPLQAGEAACKVSLSCATMTACMLGSAARSAPAARNASQSNIPVFLSVLVLQVGSYLNITQSMNA